MNLNHLTRFALHALASATAFFVVGCGESRPDSAWWQQEEERIALEHQVELKKFRFDQVFSNDFSDLQELKKSMSSTEAALAELRNERKSLTAAIESMEGQWSEFRRNAILQQRQRALGKAFPEMTLASGRSFQKVSVSSIDDGGVTIRHMDGSAKLRYHDLDAGQRVFFGLEEDLAIAAMDNEKKNAAAYEAWVSNRMASINEEKQRAAAIERREEISERKARASLAASVAARDLVAANASPLSQPSKPFARVRPRRYYSDYYYGRSYRSYGTYTPFYRACYPVQTPSTPSFQMNYLRNRGMP